MFDFSQSLSAGATASATPWTGFPPFHFVGGNIDEPTVPIDGLALAIDKVIRAEGKAMAKYGMNSGPLGYLPLRRFVAENLKRRAAMTVTAEDVLLTSGSLQAMDLVNALLLDAGDLVIVEAENYAGALSRLNRRGVETLGIDLDDGGMRMDRLAAALADLKRRGRKPKYIFTIPTVQNPTGTVMSRERRLELLALAREHDVPIFEDDCYADLLWSGERPPAIHALDEDGRVLYCGTFSKTVAPALRVGYLVAPWRVMRHVLPLKTDGGSGALEQMVLAEYLPAHFDAHVARILPVLRAKAQAMVGALDESFGAAADYRPPLGGIYLWVTLPEHVDTRRLAAVAAEAGIALNPGPEWSARGEADQHRMRLCFGHPSEDNIREGVAALAEVCHREFGVPLRSGNIERG